MFSIKRNKSKETKDKIMIKTIPLLPLRDIVVFPHNLAPLFVGRQKSISAMEQAMANNKLIFLTAQKDALCEDPKESDLYSKGTISKILQLLRLPDGTVKALIEGISRGEIKKYIPQEGYFLVESVEIEDKIENPHLINALLRNIKKTFEDYAKVNKKITRETVATVINIEEPARLADLVAGHIPFKVNKQQLLIQDNILDKRMENLLNLIRAEIEIIKIDQRIKGRVKKQIEKTQRDYFLNEQIRAIHKEMGEKDDFKSELEELGRRIKKKRLPKESATKIRQEFKKLKQMSPMSAEATVVRNYIDWILALPWKVTTEDEKDLNISEKILDKDHHGLEKPKERIVEYLAVQHLVKKLKGPILCFVGPPGVGKTSLAKSIARAMNRNYIRLSLGGVRDEAEIRGHRRTYIGAMPGKIIQSLKKAKSNNPVFCLDEVDKMSTDFRGDPSAALLEVLDPEQNFAFNDHYLDLDYDLSEIFFITTANNLHTIPSPLRDRMEVIEMSGYIELDKLEIFKGFLLPKQLELNGLDKKNIVLDEQAIYEIIRCYTKEAGVRNLERELSKICRKIAKKIVTDKINQQILINKEDIQNYLGVPKFRYGLAEEKNETGLSTGLAWTEVGGELLTIEAVILPGKGNLIITGKLGDVMQESAQAALTYARTRAKKLGLENNFYQNVDIHVHVPEGAIPKDGPSAGITMCTAIISALIKIPARRDTAMTGEITLRGCVLPIGGLREKLLAAMRGNIKHVLIPDENLKDLKDISEIILETLDITPVGHMDEVLKNSLAVDDPEKFFKSDQESISESIYNVSENNEESISAH